MENMRIIERQGCINQKGRLFVLSTQENFNMFKVLIIKKAKDRKLKFQSNIDKVSFNG